MVNPTIVTIAGQSPDTDLYPTGAVAAWGGQLSVTVPAAVTQDVIDNLPAIPGLALTNIGVRVRSVEIVASNTQSGGFTYNVPAPVIQKEAPDLVAGNTFLLPDVIQQAVASNGVDGGTIGFTVGAVLVDTILDLTLQPNTSLTCLSAVTNNGDGTVDPGEGPTFGIVPQPSAIISLNATSPTVAPVSATVSSAAATSTVAVPGTKAVPQISNAAGGVSSGTAANITGYAVAPDSAVGTATVSPTGVVTYTPPNNTFEGIETFTVTATDALGQSGIGTLTLDVKAGDSAEQVVNLEVTPGQLFIQECGPGDAPATCTVTMSAVQLNGKPQTSTGTLNQLTVVDARGLPLPWTLTAQLAGPLQNTTPPAPTTGTEGNNRIEADQMTLQDQSCAVVFGGDYSATTAGTAGTLDGTVTVCQAAVGASGGTFSANANLSLNVNPDIYVGSYTGTINFLLA